MDNKYIILIIAILLIVALGGAYAYITSNSAPEIKSISPSNNAKNVTANKTVRINFTQPIQAGSTYNNISIKKVNAEPIPITKSINGNVLAIKPSNNATFNNGATYVITIPPNAVKNLNGKGFQSNKIFYFTVAT